MHENPNLWVRVESIIQTSPYKIQPATEASMEYILNDLFCDYEESQNCEDILKSQLASLYTLRNQLLCKIDDITGIIRTKNQNLSYTGCKEQIKSIVERTDGLGGELKINCQRKVKKITPRRAIAKSVHTSSKK